VPPAHATLDEITAFLAPHPPFAALDADTLATVAASTEIEYFPAGAEILSQEGPPTEHLYVVRRGAVELLDEGEVIDVLEEGESFGHSSLLADLPPSFTARAREDTLCYLFPSEAARALLSEAEGIRYVVTTLRSRLAHATARAHEATPWATAHVRTRASPALVCAPDTSIREVAERMTAEGRSVVVVPLRAGVALVTDRILREQVVAGPRAPDDPVAALDLEALVELLERDAEALVVADGNDLLGVVDQAALLDLDAPSPFLVRGRVLAADTVDDVASVLAEVPRLAARLLDASVEAVDVLDVLTAVTDAATRRLTELVVAELGPPPAPWAWLTLGSAARREQTLATDQDTGLAFAGIEKEVARYFERFAERMTAWLARAGYAECRAGVMARNPGWRMPLEGWLELYESWLRLPTQRNVRLAMIGLDVRGGIGPLDVEPELERLLAELPRFRAFLDELARAATAERPPLGFLRDFVVERSGRHVGTLDIKTGGVLPIVNLARYHAFTVGSSARRTTDRLRAAAARGALPVDTADELQDAFATVSRLRLEHQVTQIERGETPDNQLDPRELPPLVRRRLKEAFQAIARAQSAIVARPATRIP
jgi:CBS domain-containing protein